MMFDFTKNEIRDLIISVIILAIAFSRFLSNFFFEGLLTMIIIITLVFVSHEMGHRTIARYFDAHAYYKIWPMGLILALITSLFGFIFAAPGAVYISPIIKKNFAFTVARLSKKQFALIAAAGPIVNILIGFGLLAVTKFMISLTILTQIAEISFFLAIFNMIPFPPLDGQKIIGWDWRVWLILIGSAILGYMFLISV
ncbi:MAG: peptidase [Nanoarchaeota archaeon]|nr:peptidase [Nanoarchaeota archaeon]